MDTYNSLLIAGIVPVFLWIYIVSCFQKTVFYNLYVNRVRTLLFKPVTFVQRLLPEKAPDWAAALLLMAAYAMLRCYTQLGLFDAAFAAGAGHGAAALPLVFALMLLSPLKIICQLNIIRAAMEWRGQRARGAGGVRECLDAACWPLPRAGKPLMSALASLAVFLALPLLVWASGAVLAAMGQGANGPSFAFTMQTLGTVVQSAKLDALNTLLLLRALVMVCIIASFAGPLFGRMDISGMANEWLDAISRIFTDRKIGVGLFDFTPVIIYFAAGWLHAFFTS